MDWYQRKLPSIVFYCSVFGLAFLTLAVWRLVSGDVIQGLIWGGGCGAMVSVLSKLPPLTAFGELSVAVRNIVSRIGKGLLATIVGAGLLASGYVSLPLPPGTAGKDGATRATFGDVIEQCGRTRARPEPRAEGISAPPGTRETARPAEARSGAPRCATGDVFLLLALAIVLGFSERALPSFEDKIFPTGQDQKKKS